MQIKFSTMFFWLFSMAGSTVSGRFHCDGCGKRQTTFWRSVNNTISQVHCEVWFTLGEQEIPARPNSVDVRVATNLKLYNFTRSFAIIQLHQPFYKLRLAPTRCSLDSQYVPIRCSLPVERTKTRSANKRLASIAVFSGFALHHQSYSHCP